MCLNINYNITNEVANGPDEIKVWKALILISDKNLISAIWSFYWKPGENIAEDELEKNEWEVNGGCFHVFLDHEDAKLYCETRNYNLVEFTAKKEDFVAGGYWNRHKSACFTKLHLSQEEYNKHVSDNR